MFWDFGLDLGRQSVKNLGYMLPLAPGQGSWGSPSCARSRALLEEPWRCSQPLILVEISVLGIFARRRGEPCE